MRHYVTYFDCNYLAKGVAMLRSLARHELRPHQVFVVCMDELTRTLLNAMQLPNVTTIPVHAIERGDDALVGPRTERERVEYYWTLTPTIILRILEHDPQIEVLTYLDADLFFFGSPDPIFDELGDASILIHEHRFSPDLEHLAENGRFNVGLLCFRNDQRGHAALTWWRDRCIEWCFKRLEDGKMGDQLYLEDWPTRFAGVHVLQHIGAGVAPWNHIQYDVAAGPTVDAKPVVFYHFHALAVVSPELIVPASHAVYRLDESLLEHVFVPYADAIAAAFSEVQQHQPTFRFGLTGAEGIDAACAFIARPEIASLLADAGVRQPRAPLTPTWDVYRAPQLVAKTTPRAASPATPPAVPAPAVTTESAVVTTAAAPSVVVALGGSDCTCRLERLAIGGAELVVACPASLADDVMRAAPPPARIVVTPQGATAATGVNLALTLCRRDIIVIADLAAAHEPTWLTELYGQFDETLAVRSAGAMMLARAQLERIGGLAESFDHLGAALDDFALRMHAHRQRIAIEAAPRVYPAGEWKLLRDRWGVPPDRGQTGELLDALQPPPQTLARIALPDVARTHVLDGGAMWRVSAA